MMKKLIFCLLMMTGAGMLNSCQQDEVVNEAPASKGVTIRASLPNNEKSRAVLKDTGEGATQTNIYWEEGDVITLTFNKDQQDYSYTFNITDYSNNQQSTTAKFVCNENIPLVEGVKYTFTYGGANQTPVQVGTTKSALKLY